MNTSIFFLLDIHFLFDFKFIGNPIHITIFSNALPEDSVFPDFL